jgi:hypothetical protein
MMLSKMRHMKELRLNLPPFLWKLGLKATPIKNIAETFSLTEINHNVIILLELYIGGSYLSRVRPFHPTLFHCWGDADDDL